MSTLASGAKRIAYSLPEFCERTGMNKRTARDLAQRGELPARKRGQLWFIDAEIAETYFKPIVT